MRDWREGKKKEGRAITREAIKGVTVKNREDGEGMREKRS